MFSSLRKFWRHRLVCAVILSTALAAADRTALDDYVQAPDASYRYELVGTLNLPGLNAYVLNMVSQTWRSRSEVDRTEWQHWLTIVVPERAESRTALLIITGGSNDGRAPVIPDPLLGLLALETRSVVAELRMVPNQPLTFAGESRPRTEDALIAYTWDRFLNTGDATWPARLPMTKAAVRAMDTVSAFLASPVGGRVPVERFVVTGGSKRGWTAWTAAAVDHRVIAVIPLVIDLLNVEKSFQHHIAAYGFWAPAIQDYVAMGIMEWQGTPQFRALMEIEDPHEYRDRLTMPKYIVNSAGDQFFLPDSSQFYFDQLPGEKYLRYVPNTDHSLANSDAADSVVAYYDALLRCYPRPRFSWRFDEDGSIRVRTIDRPLEVKLWQATNAKQRDFRLETIGPAYRSTVLEELGGGIFVGRVPAPAEGWTAFFVELTFASGGRRPFRFTTAVRVIPDLLPFASE